MIAGSGLSRLDKPTGMSGARQGKGGGEEMGHIVGGHQRLIDAMVARARELGVQARTEAPVSGLAMDADGAITGVELGAETLEFDLTIPTLQPPALRFLLPERHQDLLQPCKVFQFSSQRRIISLWLLLSL